LSSIANDKAERNPAMKAFFLSSLQNLLIKQRIPLYNAFKKATNKANLTESKFDFMLILFSKLRLREKSYVIFTYMLFKSFNGLIIFGKWLKTDFIAKAKMKLLYQPRRTFSKHPKLCLHMSVLLSIHVGKLIFFRIDFSFFY
jgi:hypothetical protein